MSGKVPVGAGSVTGCVVVDAADDGPVLHHLGESRKMLTDTCAGDVRGYFSESGTNVGWSVRLEIEGVVVAKTTPGE